MLVGKENGLIEILLLIVFQHGGADKAIIADVEQKSKPQKGVRKMKKENAEELQNEIKQTREEINEARDQCRQAGMFAVAALIISGVALIIRLL